MKSELITFAAAQLRPKRRAAVAAIFCGLLTANTSAALAANACNRIADFSARSCAFEVEEEYWDGLAGCNNRETRNASRVCRRQVARDREAAVEDCEDVRRARRTVCARLARSGGGGRYNPDFGDFVSPLDIGSTVNPNAYLPIQPGNRWEYEDGDGTEKIVVEVTNQTKSIEDVTCVVVTDIVSQDFTEDEFESAPVFGVDTEKTDDWMGQSADGHVVYCGEISINMEPQPGDDPLVPAEITDVEGSWKWGRDHAQPGILMFATPRAGVTYRQEYLRGDAEDVGEVRRTKYVFGMGDRLDNLIPEELRPPMSEFIVTLCADTGCVVTKDYTPLEPGAREFKFYAPGVGMILEVNPDPDEGGYVKLVNCTVGGIACPAL